MKDNRVLEPDLVPVSSTVIPLPSYEVGYGLNVSHGIKYPKTSYHDDSKLVTEQNKKKYYYGQKKQPNDSKKKTE
ncbi:hypothetical protein QE152_g6972 [Popillia japonica]|uniref:Uncharacterized protein n=1 Tax=Popillia japonica TaxID=7064 RepID=A0AAW1MCS0_POPJA